MKRIILLVVLSVILSAFALAPAQAQAREITIIVDGRKIQPDAPAYTSHARVMVPQRFIAEAFGFNVSWAGMDAVDPIQIYPVIPGVNDQLQGTRDFGYFSLRPGGSTMVFKPRRMENNGTVTTGSFHDEWVVARGDAPVEIRNGRTFIPLRMVAEAFGCNVDWNPATRTVTVSTYDPRRVISYHPVLRDHHGQDLRPGGVRLSRNPGSDYVRIIAHVLNDRPVFVNDVTLVFYVNGREVGRATQGIVYNRHYPDSHGSTAEVLVHWPVGESRTVKVVVDPDRKHWDRDRGNNVLIQDLAPES